MGARVGGVSVGALHSWPVVESQDNTDYPEYPGSLYRGGVVGLEEVSTMGSPVSQRYRAFDLHRGRSFFSFVSSLGPVGMCAASRPPRRARRLVEAISQVAEHAVPLAPGTFADNVTVTKCVMSRSAGRADGEGFEGDGSHLGARPVQVPEGLAGAVDALVRGQVGVHVVHRRFDPIQQVPDRIQPFDGHQHLTLGELVRLGQGARFVGTLAMRRPAVSAFPPRPWIRDEPASTPGTSLLCLAQTRCLSVFRHCDEIVPQGTSLISRRGLLYLPDNALIQSG